MARVRNENGPTKTKLVYEEPKTEKSKASVPISENVLRELREHKKRQNKERLFFGPKYHNNDLVFCTPGRQAA
ncbi:spore coat polysaccharide biosynthesis predicted glycosyltransferase SpsG [Desulfofundulus luciae]|uniref:Spore coat polysaccharide biosynthesis predicted glycosyltransferase SpsG n=1 Tax=Desulfofundulus luciae TaxID=74702 RepID=A0ABU0AYW0_9FIRM|nr:hypothetical protein [Desulfofundulus luciae]MDQ0285664.1 spore coat polysaccharide biosynthesis predicted glycosyltransferase SpsG [Desulfofundulus luciae]